MKILIIGGTGLISTGITRFLVEHGDDVTIYNRGKQNTDVPESVKKIIGDRKDYVNVKLKMEYYDGKKS